MDTVGEPVKWENVGTLDIAEFKRYLLNKKQKPATINRALSALSSHFARNGRDKDNPCRTIRSVPQTVLSPRSLNRRDQQRFIASIKKYGNQRDYAIAALILHTGLRVSELCSLEVGDITIRPRSGNVDIHSKHSKGSKYRKIPLNATIRRVLSDYLSSHSPDLFLFFSAYKNKLTPRNVQKAFSKYSRLSGVSVSPHILRHTFCKNLIDAGESIEKVALLAGHSSLNITMRYILPREEDLQTSVEKIAWQ